MFLSLELLHLLGLHFLCEGRKLELLLSKIAWYKIQVHIQITLAIIQR